VACASGPQGTCDAAGVLAAGLPLRQAKRWPIVAKRRLLPHVEGFKITAQTKCELVQNLIRDDPGFEKMSTQRIAGNLAWILKTKQVGGEPC
jgi:hypothetical protein